MPTPEQVARTLEQYVERFNAGDGDRWVSLFHPHARQEDPVGTPANVGHAAIKAFYENVRSLGPSRIDVLQEPIVIGGEAILCFEVTSELGEQKVRMPFIVDLFEVDDDGLITSLRAFFDPSSAVVEAG